MKKILQVLVLFSAVMAFQPTYSQCPLTQAVDFTVTDLEGNTIHLFDILDNEGKYVVIDFFFTGCGPCQQAAPFINEAYEYFGCGGYDVKFIAMDTGDDNASCEWFDETFGVTYPTVSGVEGGGTAVCNAYGIPAYPTVILIAPDHSIVEQDIWPIPNANAVINPLLSYGIEPHECGSVLTADFSADNTNPCLGSSVQFTSNSIGEITSFNWTFEGGNPETSTEENPMVVYEVSGNYNVSLTVSDGTNENTMSMDDYIQVAAMEASFISDETDICENGVIHFTSNTNCVEEYEWVFEGGTPSTSNEANPSVTYSNPGIYSVSLTAINGDNELEVIEDSFITVHHCSGLGELNRNRLSIQPNPGDGNFEVILPGEGTYTISVYDITGQMVHTATLSKTQTILDITSLKSGVYIVSAKNGVQDYKERVIIK